MFIHMQITSNNSVINVNISQLKLKITNITYTIIIGYNILLSIFIYGTLC